MFKISLRAARVNACLSQKEVAEACNVSNKTVCSWENGDSSPNAEKTALLCELYKIPYEHIDFLRRDSLKANRKNVAKSIDSAYNTPNT